MYEFSCSRFVLAELGDGSVGEVGFVDDGLWVVDEVGLEPCGDREVALEVLSDALLWLQSVIDRALAGRPRGGGVVAGGVDGQLSIFEVLESLQADLAAGS